MEKLAFLHIQLNSADDHERSQIETLSSSGYADFETCQRRLVFFSEEEFRRIKENVHGDSLEFFEDEKALEFLLHVLCGFKSRVIGENEIFGQFKVFIEKLNSNQRALNQVLCNKEFLRFIFETVKEVRSQYISKWGVQSYGAMLRKFLKSKNEVSLIGFGHLAEELLPWLKNKKLNLFVRHPDKVNALVLHDFFEDKYSINAWPAPEKLDEVVIVAAPVPTEILNRCTKVKMWIDFRALDGKTQTSLAEIKPDTFPQVLELKDIFLRLEQESAKARSELPLVEAWLAEKVQLYVNRSSHRPKGWDDLCA